MGKYCGSYVAANYGFIIKGVNISMAEKVIIEEIGIENKYLILVANEEDKVAVIESTESDINALLEYKYLVRERKYPRESKYKIDEIVRGFSVSKPSGKLAAY